ncbi:MAG: hypothetical protein ACPG8C_07315, partial [Parvibaculales bacterium]
VMFGSPETTTGGNALKFYSSCRLDIRRIGAIKDRDEVIGNQTRVKVVKNKVAPPFRVVEFDILYGEGISKMGELIDLGVKANVVEKSGSWYSYGSQRIGQGKENTRKFLIENPDMAAEIEEKIRADAGLIDIEALTQDDAKMAEGQDEEPPVEEPPVAIIIYMRHFIPVFRRFDARLMLVAPPESGYNSVGVR